MRKNRYCTLFIVRHGETEWNLKGLLQGHTDIPLNKTGEKQAKLLAKKLQRINFPIVFSSDLLRAKRTAEILALEKKIAVKTTKAIRERSFGRYEGTNWRQDKTYQKTIEKFLHLSVAQRFKTKAHQDTESDEELMGRFIPFIREVSVAYPGKQVLVVTHGGVIRAFLNHLDFGRGKTLSPGLIENTAYIKILCDGVDFFIKETQGIDMQIPIEVSA